MHTNTGWLQRLGQVCLFYLMLLWLGAMLLAGNFGLLPLLAAPRSFREPLAQQLISGLFRLFLWGAQRCGLMHLDLHALDGLNRHAPVLLVANHPSMIDVFLIVSRVHRTVCLMKASIGANLLLGIGAYVAGYVSNRHPDAMLRQAIRALAPGQHLLVFPEGTRTTHQPVNALKPGVALIAKRAHVPLQTIFLVTNSPYLSKGWPLFRPPQFPLIYKATLGAQLASSGACSETANHLQAHFEQHLSRPIDPSLRT